MKVFGDHDAATLGQLQTCIDASEGAEGVLCADAHLGYSMPIGGVVAYVGHISPTGVGFDIGCGNMAVKTNIQNSELTQKDWLKLAKAINDNISFGLGRKATHQITDHPLFEKIAASEQKQLLSVAQSQLGTVGSGNHYVDVLVDTNGFVWVANHFGSRGFGFKIASGFLNLAKNKEWDAKGSGEQMISPPTLIPLNTPLADAYYNAMCLAGDYAYAGREIVISKMLELLGNPLVLDTIHNHHNFGWWENGKMVIRKGSTPLFPNQRGFIGGSMGDICVIAVGIDTPLAKESLYSAPHGAGRVMSRTKAAGKVKKRRIWACGNYRECDFTSLMHEFKRGKNKERPTCPKCQSHLQERFVEERKSEGAVNWPLVREQLNSDGIILVGGGADEAPQVYRPLTSVLAEHANYVQVEMVMRPKIVVMAGGDVFDPFKD